jgi:hypothetical protein
MSKTPTKKDGKGKLTERAYKGRIKGGQNDGPKMERKTHFIVSYQNKHIRILSVVHCYHTSPYLILEGTNMIFSNMFSLQIFYTLNLDTISSLQIFSTIKKRKYLRAYLKIILFTFVMTCSSTLNQYLVICISLEFKTLIPLVISLQLSSP